MNAVAMPWFEDDDPRDLRRWALAALIVVAIHLSAIPAYLYGHRPEEIGDEGRPIAMDLVPTDDTLDQPQVAPAPEQQQPEVEKPPPPPDTSQAVVAPPEEKLPEKVEETQQPMPARSKSGAPTIAKPWEISLTRHLQKFKRYPSGAQSRGEEGTVLLSFSVDRNGHVLAHQIVRSSGFPELDAEVTALIERAQPLPPF